MKNTIKLFGVIALVSIIAISMTACKDDEESGGGATYQGRTLTGGAPSTVTLAKYGISNVNGLFNAARAVGDDPDYKGYYEDIFDVFGMSYSMLVLIWWNKTEAKYNAVCNELKSQGYDMYSFDLGNPMPGIADMPGIDIYTGIPEGTVIVSSGNYYDDYDYDDYDSDAFVIKIGEVMYYLKDFEDVPKGTMAVAFISESYTGYPYY